MDKLQYDSFYKFMVSVGVVLITAPIIAVSYFLYNGNEILISQAEYDALSTTSMQFLQQRDGMLQKVLGVCPWVLPLLIIIGLICLIYGSTKWHAIQKELDKQTKLKTKKEQHDVDQLSVSEIAAKAIDETADEHEETEESSDTPLYKERVVKALEIENLCFKLVCRENAVGYSIHPNVKVGNQAYDILAISKRDNFDYIYEVKYWTKTPHTQLLDRVANRLGEMSVKYEMSVHRNCRGILMIVTTDELKKSIQQVCGEYAKTHPISFDYRILTEKEL